MRERGSTTLLAVVMAAVAVLAALSVGGWRAAGCRRQRPGEGARREAQPGPEPWVTGQQPCPAAGDLARENGAVLVGCAALDEGVWTRVSVRTDVVLLGRGVPITVEREAWAGPARPAPAPAGS